MVCGSGNPTGRFTSVTIRSRRTFCELAAKTSAALMFGSLPETLGSKAHSQLQKNQNVHLASDPKDTTDDKSRCIPTLKPLTYVRKMRGGTQSHLIRCSDGELYVVKFRNNPQHLKVLSNELMAGLLAEAVGLSVPRLAIIDIALEFVKATPDLKLQLLTHTVPCEPGLQFGSRYVVNPLNGRVLDYLPASVLCRVRNRNSLSGILAFDKWTSNADQRQVVFWRLNRERLYTATFIDYGYCFNGEMWTFPYFPFQGVLSDNEAYLHVCGWESFEPWLSRIEVLSEKAMWNIAGQIPPEWYYSDWSSMEILVETLIERRKVVRQLISEFRGLPRHPFPNWKAATI